MEIGLNEVMEQGLDDFNEFHDAVFGEDGNNLTLFTVTQNDFTNYYIMEKLSVEELMRQFQEAENPFADMDGKKIGLEYFAWLQQSDKVSLSVTANMDEDLLKIYEINGILEENRTDSNTHIWETGLAEYIDDLPPIHTLIIQKNDNEVVEKIELEIMLGAVSNEDISKINALNNKYPDPLSYTLLDGEGVILASGAVTPELGDRINVIEDKVYDLQERYSYSVLIDEEALKALDRFQASEYPLNHFQEENEMPESFIIWSDKVKNPSEFVLYNPISEKYYHLIPSEDVMEVSDTIRMAEQYMPQEQIERFDSVRLGLPDKNAEKVKEFKEITLKFGKGCVGDEFKGRDGTAYRQILVPNVDKNDSRPWQTFVVKSNAVHKDKFGKGMWIKLPADGHTTLKRTVIVGEKPDGKKEWGVEKTKVSNADLKKMVESYKEKSKPSLTGKLANKNAEAKQENGGKQQDKDIKEKSIKKDLS